MVTRPDYFEGKFPSFSAVSQFICEMISSNFNLVGSCDKSTESFDPYIYNLLSVRVGSFVNLLSSNGSESWRPSCPRNRTGEMNESTRFELPKLNTFMSWTSNGKSRFHTFHVFKPLNWVRSCVLCLVETNISRHISLDVSNWVENMLLTNLSNPSPVRDHHGWNTPLLQHATIHLTDTYQCFHPNMKCTR